MERNKGCAGPLLGARHAFIKVESNQLNCLHSNERVMKMRVFLIAVTMLIVSACGGGGGGSSSQQVPVSQGGSSGGSGGSGSSGGGSSNNGPEWVEGEFGDWTQDYIAQCENPRSSSEYDDTQGSTALEKFGFEITALRLTSGTTRSRTSTLIVMERPLMRNFGIRGFQKVGWKIGSKLGNTSS